MRLGLAGGLVGVLAWFGCSAAGTGHGGPPSSEQAGGAQSGGNGSGGDAGVGQTHGGSGSGGNHSGNTGGSSQSGSSHGGAGLIIDAGGDVGSPFDPDAACAVAKETARVEKLPVDIIWMVDNSSSMRPAIEQVQQGLNDFVAQLGDKELDYRVVLLSLRGKGAVGSRYGVCVPEPLAGDNNCGNSSNFFHSSIDIRSTQPLEQFLGTLGDTQYYRVGDERGPKTAADANWKAQLRESATRTIVIVSDDDSRLSASQFESWPGGGGWAPGVSANAILPQGILGDSWGGLFDGYQFSGIYGWGSESDPGVKCSYPDGSAAAKPGRVYTDLVQKTGGVRAKLCDGAAAWAPFFDQVASAVERTSQIRCEMEIPDPGQGDLDPALVNVSISSSSTQDYLYKVSGEEACDSGGGWYYNTEINPTHVVLCPSSCEAAQSSFEQDALSSVDIYFGCQTRIK